MDLLETYYSFWKGFELVRVTMHRPIKIVYSMWARFAYTLRCLLLIYHLERCYNI